MSDGRTTWRTIADDLRTAIGDGEYEPGARLPSRSKLMARYGVADGTVTNAINALRTEGLITGLSGSGWYVRTPRPVIRLARNRLRRSESKAGPGTVTSDAQDSNWTTRTDVDIRTEAADDEVAGLLGVDTGSPVLVRDRVMYADDEPVQLACSYFPYDLAGIGIGIKNQDTGLGDVDAQLEDAGLVLQQFEECVRIGQASKKEAERLTIAMGAPVFRIARVAHTPDRAVEITRIVANGERFELHYVLPAE
jgi:GntR family transcriptional regulator